MQQVESFTLGRLHAFVWDEEAHPRDDHGRFGDGDGEPAGGERVEVEGWGVPRGVNEGGAEEFWAVVHDPARGGDGAPFPSGAEGDALREMMPQQWTEVYSAEQANGQPLDVVFTRGYEEYRVGGEAAPVLPGEGKALALEAIGMLGRDVPAAGPVTVEFVRLPSGDVSTGGSTYRGDDGSVVITIADRYVMEVGDRALSANAVGGHGEWHPEMPSSTTAAGFTLAHEWGHATDPRDAPITEFVSGYSEAYAPGGQFYLPEAPERLYAERYADSFAAEYAWAHAGEGGF